MSDTIQTPGGQTIEGVTLERDNLLQEALKHGGNWNVAQWEDYLNKINPNFMSLGLERVLKVEERLKLNLRLQNTGALVITVAGTNGKGSTSALVAGVFNNLGYNVGLYTSPHLFKFNERIQINGLNIEDQLLCDSLYAVTQAQAQEEVVYLTYFEIITLAAVYAMVLKRCDLLVLEVGLGGRLDAVNIFYNEISVITSIGLDHVKILGSTTSEIAFEKAGIIKPHSNVIIGSNMDLSARQEILRVAKYYSAHPCIEGDGFSTAIVDCLEPETNLAKLKDQDPNLLDSLSILRATKELQYKDKSHVAVHYFPYPRIPLSCAGIALKTVFMAFEAMNLPQDGYQELTAIAQALSNVCLPGRMQLVQTRPNLYLDVAHNVPAAVHLCQHLEHLQQLSSHLANINQEIKTIGQGKLYAVIGMLKDKDIEGVLKVLSSKFDYFYVASLPGMRGESKVRLEQSLSKLKSPEAVKSFDLVEQALAQALKDATEDDTIVVVGSFVTVSEAYQSLNQDK